MPSNVRTDTSNIYEPQPLESVLDRRRQSDVLCEQVRADALLQGRTSMLTGAHAACTQRVSAPATRCSQMTA
jgi:hypothetical protein